MRPNIQEIRERIAGAIPSAVVEVTRCQAQGRAKADFVVSLALKGIHLVLNVEWVDSPSTAILKSKVDHLERASETEPETIPVFMASYFTQSQRQWLAEAGVAFIDLEGNAWIEGEGVYISKVGPKNARPRKLSAPNPFSDKASMVARQLISSGDPVGVRELSSLIGLTPGYVSKVLGRLESLGYLSRDAGRKVVARDSKALLQDWAAAYDYTKNRMTGFFCRARSANDVIKRFRVTAIQADYALTAQAGAYLIAPYAAFDRVDVYSAGPSATAELVSRLGLEPVNRGANVFVWDPYYRHSAFFGRREVQGVWVASDIQLYLDLFRYPLRGPEQAQHLYEVVLKHVVERDG